MYKIEYTAYAVGCVDALPNTMAEDHAEGIPLRTRVAGVNTQKYNL